MRKRLMKIKISLGRNKTDNSPRDYTLSYYELSKLLLTFSKEITTKENASHFIGGTFAGKSRSNENLEKRSLITLDLDNYDNDISSLEGVFRTKFKDYGWLAYSTASHTPKKPKIRIVFLLEKPVSGEDYRIITMKLIDELGIANYLDVAASTCPSQFMNLPIKPSEDYIPWSQEKVGDPVRVMKIDHKENDLVKIVKNQPLDITDDQVNEYLSKYDPESTDYYAWVKVGMALHHQYSGGDIGKKVWYKWSIQDTRYEKEDIKNQIISKWSSFDQKFNPVTFASIIKLVKIQEYSMKENSYGFNDAEIPICRSKWIDTKGEKLTPKFTVRNFKILLDFYKINVKHDIIEKELKISFNMEQQHDLNVAVTMIKSLCELNDIKVTTRCLNEMVDLIGNLNKFNSFKEWVESSEWDGKSRFESFCDSVKVDDRYTLVRNKYIRRWLIQALRVVCLNDELEAKVARSVLVFKSKQHTGKTTWFKSLLPPEVRYLLDEAKTMKVDNDMSVYGCIKKVFIELGELGATFRKADSEQFKNFISSTSDTLNIKYVARPKEFRRRTVFFGTVNDSNFLLDNTGSSRFMVLPVNSCDAYHNVNMQQLFAELYIDAKMMDDDVMTEEELKAQSDFNSEFEMISPLQELFQSKFNMDSDDRDRCMNATSVLLELGYPAAQIKKSHTNELAQIFDNIGYERKIQSPKGWYLPPLMQDDF